MLKPLSPEERALPYASYYDLPMPDPLPEDAACLDTPLTLEQILPVRF